MPLGAIFGRYIFLFFVFFRPVSIIWSYPRSLGYLAQVLGHPRSVWVHVLSFRVNIKSNQLLAGHSHNFILPWP